MKNLREIAIPLVLLLVVASSCVVDAQWTQEGDDASTSSTTAPSSTTTASTSPTTASSSSTSTTTTAPTSTTTTAPTSSPSSTTTTVAPTTASSTTETTTVERITLGTNSGTLAATNMGYVVKPLFPDVSANCPVCPPCKEYYADATTITIGGANLSPGINDYASVYKDQVIVETIQPTTVVLAGRATNYGDHDYQAIVFASNDREIGVYCSGAFVDYRVVLTAAHCLYDDTATPYKYVRVTNGNADRTTLTYLSWMTAENSVTVHPEFRAPNFTESSRPLNASSPMLNDLAIVQLGLATALDNVKPIKIVGDDGTVRNRGTFTVTGYGKDANGYPNRFLRAYTMDMRTRADCASVFGPRVCSSDQFLVARGAISDRDSLCRVESGAPMIQTRAFARKKLVALASFVSSRDCSIGNLDGYVSLPYYRSWIMSVAPSVSTFNNRDSTGGNVGWGLSF